MENKTNIISRSSEDEDEWVRVRKTKPNALNGIGNKETSQLELQRNEDEPIGVRKTQTHELE